MKTTHTQQTIAQLSELTVAASNHEKMAKLHENAGNLRLAESSRLDAYERRLAHDYLSNAPEQGLQAALDYATMRRNAKV